MKTEIDAICDDYQKWGLEGLSFRSGILTLTLSTFKGNDDPIVFLVVFAYSPLYEVYDESQHFQNYHERREGGVVGKYSESSFLDYASNKTNVVCLHPGKLQHYSVMTTNEVVHVLAEEPPKVWRVA